MSARGRDGGSEVPEPMTGEDLVSLLYGELEPDQAERTSARVAGDPTAAARLGEMRRVRELFASLDDEEPPSRLTAQLMAEAARSAPQMRSAGAVAQPEAGLWARFVFWLQPLVQRPALAAAASLVLVAGVAGILYVKKGDELTSTAPTADHADEPSTGSPAPPPAAESQPAVAATDTAANQAAQDTDGLADGDEAEEPAEEALGSERAPTRADKPVAKRSKKAESAPAGKAYDKAPARPGVKSGTVYGLSEQEMVPRDEVQAGGEAGGPVGGAAPNKSDAPAPQTPPEPTPSAPPADSKASPRPNVQELHKRAIDAALDKRCAEVKMLAGQVRATDSAYYARNVAGDKRLQGCLASPSRSPAKK